MSVTIPLVYNWIGPLGPMPNNEVPNVLNFTAVSTGLDRNIYKHYFGDRIAQLFVENRNFMISSVYHLLSCPDTITFIYPLQLDWRLQFYTYWTHDYGILEYGQVRVEIISRVQFRRGYFLIDLSHETFVSDSHLNVVESYFKHRNIPLDKIIYVTGCSNAQEIMHNRIQRNGESIHLVLLPVAWIGMYMYARSNTHNKLLPPKKLPSKLFLSFNRRYRFHRFALAIGLNSHGLTDRMYTSMPETEPGQKVIKFMDQVRIFRHKLLSVGITEKNCEEFNALLPLAVDGQSDLSKMMAGSERHYYTDSLISLITETNYEEHEISITEKTFKAFINQHPFIIIGSAFTLQHIRQLGFKTFSPWINESYDVERDPIKRMQMILDECVNISKWTSEQQTTFRTEIIEILQHNYNLVRTSPIEIMNSAVLKIIRGHI